MPNTTVYVEGGPVANVHYLLEALEVFAVTQGWTVNRSVVGEAMADIDVPVGDSAQSGWVTTSSSPWVSNYNDMATITDSVIEFTIDKGNDYYVQLDGFTVDEHYEVEFEIIDTTIGTLQLMFGEHVNRYSASDRRIHKFIYKMSAGGYIRFESDDFLGTFKVLSIKKRIYTLDMSLEKSGVGFFNFRSQISSVHERTDMKGPFIFLTSSNGFDAGQSYAAQPGTSDAAYVNGLDDYYANNLFGYFFFATSRHIYVVVEVRQGEFAHFGFGISKKYFDFRGGNFVYGTSWKWGIYCNDNDWSRHSFPIGYYHYDSPFNYYRADLLGNTLDSFLQDGPFNTLVPYSSYMYGTYHGHTNQTYTENNYYGTAPLSPVFFASQDINSYRYSLGEMEEYRLTYCKFLDPKTELAINGEIWKVFPIKRKQLTIPEEYVPNSGTYALAYYIGPSA